MKAVAGLDVILSTRAASNIQEMNTFDDPAKLVRRGRLGPVSSVTVSALLALPLLTSSIGAGGGPTSVSRSAFDVVDELNYSTWATHLSSVGQGSMPGSIVSAVVPQEEPHNVPDVLAVRVPRRVIATVAVQWKPGTLPRRAPFIRPDLGPWEEDE